jgi:hypothetical protein
MKSVLKLVAAPILAAFIVGCSHPEGPAQPIDLIDAVSGNYIDYTVSGQGISTNVQLHLHNKSDQHWEVHVKVGTKLEPADGSVQNMTVTEEVEVEIHRHGEADASIPAACLDINKDTPAPNNRDWTIKQSPALAGFISAAKGKIDEVAQADPDKFSADVRASMLQALLWKGRGATEEDMINCMVKYQGVSEDEAREYEDKMYPILEDMVSGLPDITGE